MYGGSKYMTSPSPPVKLRLVWPNGKWRCQERMNMDPNIGKCIADHTWDIMLNVEFQVPFFSSTTSTVSCFRNLNILLPSESTSEIPFQPFFHHVAYSNAYIYCAERFDYVFFVIYWLLNRADSNTAPQANGNAAIANQSYKRAGSHVGSVTGRNGNPTATAGRDLDFAQASQANGPKSAPTSTVVNGSFPVNVGQAVEKGMLQ